MATNTRALAWKAAGWGAGALCVGAGLVAARASRQRGFHGKVAVITGGSRGLGLAIAEELGKRGAQLMLAARNPDELQRAAQLLAEWGAAPTARDVLTVPADLCIQEDAQRVIDEATRRFDRVDLLVNNAGIITVGPAENQTAEDFEKVMKINFFAGLYCTLAVLPQMLERRRGAIANITSIGGKVAAPHLLPYTASKFAAVGFSEGLGVELASKGIRVTTVVPGLMRTGSPRNAIFTGDAAREYRWFSFSDNLPGISIAANRAARQIADGIADGAVEVDITPHAFLAARLGNLVPGATRTVLRVANRLLPKAQPGTKSHARGAESGGREPLTSRVIGRSAEKRYNQLERAG